MHSMGSCLTTPFLVARIMPGDANLPGILSPCPAETVWEPLIDTSAGKVL